VSRVRPAVDQLIEFIRFAGVGVAFVAVVVTVLRAALASLSTGRSKRMTEVGLDLARIVLVAIDLMLVAAILEVAIDANEVTFTRLATVAGLRIGLTLLLAFEDAYRADTTSTAKLRRPAIIQRSAKVQRPVENVWPDRARLGRDREQGWQRSNG
jgi:uncharacterized membrane protein